MAGMKIQGGLDGTEFDKFRVARDQAQQRLRRTDAETRLQEVIQKQRTPGSPAKAAAPASDASNNVAGSGQYARAGAAEKSEPKSPLGQLLDILA